MFHQLEPPIPLRIVANPSGIPEGAGLAFGLIDYGLEHHVIYGIAMDKTGEIWWVANPYVRFRGNATAGRASC